MPSPVFISYARGASLVEAQALKDSLGDLVFLDTVAIKDGEDFPDRILNGLLDSSVVVIFATGLYLDRLFCRIEMRLALQGGAHIVLSLGDGCQDVLDALDTVVSRKNWPHANETSRIKGLIDEALKNNPRTIREKLSKDVARRIAKVFQEEAEVPPPQKLPDNYSFPVGIVSSIGTRFVGRANLLRSIHRTLSAGKGESAQLTGSIVAGGGFGKTCAAIEYLHRYAGHYPGGIFWVDASNPDLHNEFWRVLKQLDPTVPDLATMRELKRDASVELGHALHKIAQPVLYVVDNIMESAAGGSPSAMHHFCPAIGAITVLATSRQNAAEAGVKTIKVDPLDRDCAILLLTDGVPAAATLAWNDWGRIAEIVGDLPIALDLLNRSLVLSAITPAKLLERLQQSSAVVELDRLSKALKGQVPEGAARGVTEAFLISYQLLDPISQRLALLLAQLAPAPIPEVFMESLPDELNSARAALHGRHFVTASENELAFGVMHRLMADFLRNVSESDAARLLDEACGVLSHAMEPDQCRDPKYWPAMNLCRQHGEAMFARSEGTQGSAGLGGRVAILVYAQGDLPAARQLQDRVVEVMTRMPGEEHLDTLSAMSNLAGILKAQGDLLGARQLHEHVVKVMVGELGEEHLTTLTVMGNLAETIKAQGDLPKARQLEEHVLEVRTRVQGKEHKDTLTPMNNLALTLWAQGDLPAARLLQERALELMIRELGEEHPNTLSSMNNLAATLSSQGDHASARKLEERVLEVRRHLMGEDSPATLTSMGNLAGTLRAQGDLLAARQLQDHVLKVMMRELGEENLRTLTSMNNLALTLHDLGDCDGAVRLLRKCLLGRRKVLGDKHQDTVSTAEALKIVEARLKTP